MLTSLRCLSMLCSRVHGTSSLVLLGHLANRSNTCRQISCQLGRNWQAWLIPSQFPSSLFWSHFWPIRMRNASDFVIHLLSGYCPLCCSNSIVLFLIYYKVTHSITETMISRGKYLGVRYVQVLVNMIFIFCKNINKKVSFLTVGVEGPRWSYKVSTALCKCNHWALLSQ